MDVLSFRTEIRRLIELRQEGEYWDFKKEWYQNKSDLLHDIICMANNLSNHDGLIILCIPHFNCRTHLPNCSRGQLQTLLRELRAEGRIRCEGKTSAAKWFLGGAAT